MKWGRKKCKKKKRIGKKRFKGKQNLDISRKGIGKENSNRNSNIQKEREGKY